MEACKKKKIRKFAGVVVCICVLFSLVLNAYATTENDDAISKRNMTVGDISSRITTTVTIRDIATGKIDSYELDNNNIQVIKESGNPEITVIIDDIGKKVARDPSQSNSNRFYGWKGNVRISWYDDGMWARLTSAGGDWTKISGNYSMTEKTIDYGQYLGTNSKSGSASFINSYNVSPDWPKGKYGSAHYVGANINGRVNNQYVNITCNYSLF